MLRLILLWCALAQPATAEPLKKISVVVEGAVTIELFKVNATTWSVVATLSKTANTEYDAVLVRLFYRTHTCIEIAPKCQEMSLLLSETSLVPISYFAPVRYLKETAVMGPEIKLRSDGEPVAIEAQLYMLASEFRQNLGKEKVFKNAEHR